MIKITAPDTAATRELLRIAPKQVKLAAAAAINRTITKTRTEISKAVRKRYTAKAKGIKSTLSSRKANKSQLQGEIVSRGRPTLLTDFAVRVRRSGPVRVQVLRQGSAKPFKGLFIGRSRKGFNGPMMRTQRRGRYPLATAYGPSVPQMIGAEPTLDMIKPVAIKTLQERFLHEVNWRLEKAGKK